MKTKANFPVELQINQARREILAIASTDCVDRDGEVVLPSGLRTKGVNYAGRPVLWSHDRQLPAIGSILWMKQTGDQILCKYRITDKTEFARDIFELIQDDCLKDHSIGFEVYDEGPPTPTELEQHPEWKDCRNIIREFEILEFSVCNVPCNPEAGTILKSKSYSDTTRKLLGSDWDIKDCWQWETKVAPESAPQIQPTVQPTPEPFVIPKPKFARKVLSTDEMILKALERHTAEELIAKIKGKA
jgi:hypothetical protein